jgi:hypothetical protein
MSDIFDNIKKLKAFEKIFLGFSNNKFILKDLDNPAEHFTMLFKSNGILDVHRTKEGSEKEYESLGKFDMIKTALKIVSNPKEFENALMDLVHSIKEVNFEESEYADYKIASLKTKEELASIAKKEKRSIVIPKESIGEFDMSELLIPWKDAKNIIKDNAVVYDKNNAPIGYLFKKEEKFYYISINILEKSSLANFIFQMINPEKLDDKTS